MSDLLSPRRLTADVAHKCRWCDQWIHRGAQFWQAAMARIGRPEVRVCMRCACADAALAAHLAVVEFEDARAAWRWQA